MPGPWDTLMKYLMRTKPQDLVTWVLQRGLFKERLSDELKATLYTDGLFLVEQDEQEVVVSLEIQVKGDPRMGERMQEYSILASRTYRYLSVYSCVIYLRKNINLSPSPLIRTLPNGKQYDRFEFDEIELADIPATQLLETGLYGIFPLALLAKDGTQPEVVDTITTTLAKEEEIDLLAIAYTLGSLVFSTDAAKEWYRRRFHMFEELISDTWVYEEIGRERFEKGIEKGIEQGIEKGIEQGIEKGIEQGIREGELRGLREAVLEIAHERFPEIEVLTKEQVEAVKTVSVLRRLIGNISKVTTVKEAVLAVLAANDDETK